MGLFVFLSKKEKRKGNKRNAEGENGGSAPLCSNVKEQLVNIHTDPRTGNYRRKHFMDLKRGYRMRKITLNYCTCRASSHLFVHKI